MFVLEIDFHDGSNDVECLLVKRPRFVVGSSRSAHVIIDEMKGLGFELQFLRGVGRTFKCVPSPLGDVAGEVPTFLENTYDKDGSFNLGPISIRISALDSDLLVRESDPPDKAGARVLRQACAFPSPHLPAVALVDQTPVTLSFAPDQTVTVGRSNKCLLRVDREDVSAEHARIGYESGQFWVEDLGSTNGTFIHQQQISGRQRVAAGTTITLAQQIQITVLSSEHQIGQAVSPDIDVRSAVVPTKGTYPALIVVSDLVRPGKFILNPGVEILLGRDPESDIWVGAPHISRKHCSISVAKTGQISLTDLSRNGIAWEAGVVPRGEPFLCEPGRQVFELGGGVNFAICFNPEEEELYRANRGSFLIAAKEQKAKETGTRADLKTLLDQNAALQQDQSGVMMVRNSVADALSSLMITYSGLSLRDRAFVLLFLISLSVIIVVVVNLVLHGFR